MTNRRIFFSLIVLLLFSVVASSQKVDDKVSIGKENPIDFIVIRLESMHKTLDYFTAKSVDTKLSKIQQDRYKSMHDSLKTSLELYNNMLIKAISRSFLIQPVRFIYDKDYDPENISKNRAHFLNEKLIIDPSLNLEGNYLVFGKMPYTLMGVDNKAAFIFADPQLNFVKYGKKSRFSLWLYADDKPSALRGKQKKFDKLILRVNKSLLKRKKTI